MKNQLVLLILLVADVVLVFGFGFSLLALLLSNLIVLAFLNRELCGTIWRTLPRDFKGIKTFIQLDLELKKHRATPTTIGSLFTDIVRQNAEKVAQVSVGEDDKRQMTFAEVEELANQIANYCRKEMDLKKDDCVALFMPNCLEYVPFWLGLSRLGVKAALVNFNQRLDALAHSICVAGAKAVICHTSLESALQDAVGNNNEQEEEGLKRIPPNVARYVYGTSTQGNTDIKSGVLSASKLPPPLVEGLTFSSPLIYIYTSGTTGLPKAAVITHGRYYMMARGVFLGFSMFSSDRLYITMPMYHSAAGILGVGAMLLSGASLCIRAKFSASRFFAECAEYDCTVSQYIGELARYLLAQKPSPGDRAHRVRMMFGNGMRPQIWPDFVSRFGIDQIGEFYGSTEGNTSLLNMDSHVGACGFIPIYSFLTVIYPICLIKVDEETGEPFRDANGMCIRCRPGESGQVVAKIVKGHPVKDFSGYLSGDATSKKIVKDVVSKGDVAFASGDILMWDADGYVYFKDRTGDTFRWKGENVSTTEVEGMVQKILMLEATAYGVEVPGADGKAGMVAIVGNPDETLAKLTEKLPKVLPPYARPVFLRFCKAVDTTGTFKLQKTALRKAAFDPAHVADDRLYYLDGKSGQYLPLNDAAFENIKAGKVRF